jgi:hypothetical protein
MTKSVTHHRKILARVCARNNRKEALVETNEPRWPYFIVRPQNPNSDVPDCFSASFKSLDETVVSMPGQQTVGISILNWSHNKGQAFNYLR